MRVVGAVLADRAEHSLGEGVVPAAADYGRSVSPPGQQPLGRMAVEHPGGDPAAFVRRHFFADHGVKSRPGVSSLGGVIQADGSLSRA